VDRATVAAYERHAPAWVAARAGRPLPSELGALVGALPPGPVADLGCGPGWHGPALARGADGQRTVVGIDAAASMCAIAALQAPAADVVRADVERLPLRRGALAGAWASKVYQHVPAPRLPLALAELHRAVVVGGRVALRVTSDHLGGGWDDPLPGRHFARWSPVALREVVEGAGFDVASLTDDGREWLDLTAVRARALPDTVGPGMRVLVVGLNPSEYSADAGYGFARPGNRFWPAITASGLVTRAPDPFAVLRVDGVGMTNLVRRPSRRADALTREEYRAGAERLQRMVAWLEPRVVCFVGLAGYRAAVDRRARAGWQPEGFGGAAAYLMPNTSGLNAHARPADFIEHFRAVASA
jgi:TDG/mug DNA glycosylase family protein